MSFFWAMISINGADIAQGIRSLSMHRLRTFLSTLGVLFGVASVIAMLAIGEGSKQEVLAQIRELGTNNIIIRQSELSAEQHKKALDAKSRGLAAADARCLQNNIALIQKQACVKILKADVSGVPQDVSPEIFAVSPSFGDIKGLELSEGRFLGDVDLLRRNQVCVLGAEIAIKLGRRGHVAQNIRIGNLQFQVVGVLSSKTVDAGRPKALNARNLDNTIFVPLGFESRLAPQAPKTESKLSEIILQLDNSDHMKMASEAIKRMMQVLHNGVDDYQIIIPYELLNQVNQTQNIFNLVLGGIAAISMFVGGIGIMNIMLATVSARTREIGIRRAVGANQYHIAKQFLVEALILTLGGALLGLVGGVILSHLIGLLAGWNVIVSVWSMFLAIGMAIFVGIASGLYPAFKAAATDPIVALRHL